ncbi:23S rRNA pseudouridine(2605) synthase RluB [Aquabacterium sp.]|uniref:23S rRNA pseudouridine(2605) synthase RluB n=1 Tax=Aquabacterium sp. TaxID=1872578 RepID=UPI0035AECE03
MTTDNVPMQEPQDPSLVTEEVVKPKRTRRTKAAADVAADVSATPVADAAPDAADAVPAAKRAPRRRKVAEAAEGAEASALEAAESAEAPAKPKRAPRKKVVADEAVATESVPVVPDAAREDAAHGVLELATVSESTSSDEGAVEQVAGDEGQSGERRERGRRDRRGRGERGQRGERRQDDVAAGASVEGDEASAEARPSRRVAMAAEQTNEVFEELVSGEFDTQRAEEVEEAASEDGAPYKRVLLPEPDAPKLQKVLAQAGVGSRRDIEQMIEDGRIEVNDQVAHVGQRVSHGDRIKVAGRPIKVRIAPPAARILAYHKPVGEVVTHDDPQGRPTVFRRLPRLQNGKWMSVGRLDLNTEGLLLFTNSGELANQLMHPRFGVEREYAVRVLGSLDDASREKLLNGVEIDGQQAQFLSISKGGGEGVNQWYRVVITEGRNREVRKLFDAVGLTVNRLIRVRYGAIVLPRGLRRGVWVELGESDVRAVKSLAGMDRPEGGARGGRGQQKPQQQGFKGGNKPQGPRPQGGGQGGQGGQGKPLFGEQGPRGERGDRGDRGPRQGQVRDRQPAGEHDDDLEFARIPNPLEQTFDRRFVKGSKRITSGFGRPDQNQDQPSGGGKQKGPRQPDPLQTSVGYIGADAYFGKTGGGGRRGGGGGRGRR